MTTPSQGHELMGLTATLLAAGCRALVGTVAPVSDRCTLDLITAFYEHLARGLSPAAALTGARRVTEGHSVAARATAVAFSCFGAGV
jgi:CHAT domain-containing protein